MSNIKLKIGDYAPSFQLKDQNDKIFNLSDFKGKKVLMSWHPLAWTSVCAEQMKSLETNFQKFESLNTVPVGMSVDTVPSKKAWAKELNINNVKLLADFWPHGEVAQKYGIFREKNGFSERVNIIIDEEQKIIFFKVYEISKLPDIEEVLRFLQENKN